MTSNTVQTFLLCVPLCNRIILSKFTCICFFYSTTVHLVTALHIFAPYSRILAFWLMLFVYNATLNKALSYLILTLVPNNKNAHKGMFLHSATRARGRVPEMLYIFVQQSVYKSLLSSERKSRGGLLGPKTDGGVPLAAENWTPKDRGKNEIWGLKDRIL